MTDTPEKPDNETAGEQPPAYGFFGALVRTMVRHRNAANLCMVIAVALGLYGLSIINRQFSLILKLKWFPSQLFGRAQVPKMWTSILLIRCKVWCGWLTGVKDFSATSTDGVAQFNLEFYTGWDMTKATADVGVGG